MIFDQLDVAEVPPKGLPAEEYNEHIKKVQLEQALQNSVADATTKILSYERDVPFAFVVVQQAAEFFDSSRGGIEDFCIQHHAIYDGVVVFGGTNRLQWSAKYGFRYSLTHCTERFIARFREIMGCDRTF